MMMSMIIVFMSLSGGSPQLKRMRRPIICSVMNIRKRKLPDIFSLVFAKPEGRAGLQLVRYLMISGIMDQQVFADKE